MPKRLAEIVALEPPPKRGGRRRTGPPPERQPGMPWTVAEVAAELRVSTGTINRAIRAGLIETIPLKIGGRRRGRIVRIPDRFVRDLLKTED